MLNDVCSKRFKFNIKYDVPTSQPVIVQSFRCCRCCAAPPAASLLHSYRKDSEITMAHYNCMASNQNRKTFYLCVKLQNSFIVLKHR
jgi:hypothetical protein